MTDPSADVIARIVQEVKPLLEKLSNGGEWRSMRDGNQYLETRYLPTAKCVGASRVDGLPRPWNPHAFIAFGLKAEDYEVSRFTDADADFIAAAPRLLRQLLDALASSGAPPQDSEALKLVLQAAKYHADDNRHWADVSGSAYFESNLRRAENRQKLRAAIEQLASGAPPQDDPAINQAARLLRLWARDRQSVSGKWTAQEQAAIECAIRLEQLALVAPQRGDADGAECHDDEGIHVWRQGEDVCVCGEAEISGAPQRTARRACECLTPDPVMQADMKFYCYRCSFETGARPRDLSEMAPQQTAEGWRPIETLDDPNREVLLWAPVERLYSPPYLPSMKPDMRVSTKRDWTWATLWMPKPADPPSSAPGITPPQEPR